MISFICRVHNEEATVRESLTSLFALAIPIEIVVILHRCTDSSAEIVAALASEAPPHVSLVVVRYEVQMSRAGVETMVTSPDSRHSIVDYLNRCFGLASHKWKFHWAPDFIATPAFISFLNSYDYAVEKPTAVKFWHTDDDGVVGAEHYLYNCLICFVKHLFWEVTMMPGDVDWTDAPIDASLIHRSSLAHAKPYWYAEPWFMNPEDPQDEEEAAELRKRYKHVVSTVGPEPFGSARSGNPKSIAYEQACWKIAVWEFPTDR